MNNAVSAIIQVLAAAAQLHTPVTFDSILSETLCVSLSQFYSEQKYSHTFKYIYSQTTRQFTIEFTVRPNNFQYMKEQEGDGNVCSLVPLSVAASMLVVVTGLTCMLMLIDCCAKWSVDSVGSIYTVYTDTRMLGNISIIVLNTAHADTTHPATISHCSTQGRHGMGKCIISLYCYCLRSQTV